jgi:hypothetical protein
MNNTNDTNDTNGTNEINHANDTKMYFIPSCHLLDKTNSEYLQNILDNLYGIDRKFEPSIKEKSEKFKFFQSLYNKSKNLPVHENSCIVIENRNSILFDHAEEMNILFLVKGSDQLIAFSIFYMEILEDENENLDYDTDFIVTYFEKFFSNNLILSDFEFLDFDFMLIFDNIAKVMNTQKIFLYKLKKQYRFIYEQEEYTIFTDQFPYEDEIQFIIPDNDNNYIIMCKNRSLSNTEEENEEEKEEWENEEEFIHQNPTVVIPEFEINIPTLTEPNTIKIDIPDTTTIYDPIELVDLNLQEYLKSDPSDNIVIQWRNTYHPTTKSLLWNMIHKNTNISMDWNETVIKNINSDNLFLNCGRIEKVLKNFVEDNTTEIDRKHFYFNLRKIGLFTGGFIEITEFYKCFRNPLNQLFKITSYEPEITLPTVISVFLIEEMFRNRLNHDYYFDATSLAHCQKGQEGKLYHFEILQPIFSSVPLNIQSPIKKQRTLGGSSYKYQTFKKKKQFKKKRTNKKLGKKIHKKTYKRLSKNFSKKHINSKK